MCNFLPGSESGKNSYFINSIAMVVVVEVLL